MKEKKISIFSLFLFFLLLTIYKTTKSQNSENDLNLQQPATVVAEETITCGFDTFLNESWSTNAPLREIQEELETKYQRFLSKRSDTEGKELEHKNARTLPPDYTLPVVVHIIHDNGVENISDDQVIQAIADLNEAFENIDYYDSTIGVDTKIAFCLAVQDPDGNATTGITRTASTLTHNVNVNSPAADLALKDLSRWNPLKYINIWVVGSIAGNVAGYATLPASLGNDNDGIVNEAQYFGTSQSNSTVHIHEMGHYLGLYHTFQGGCTNNNCLTDGDRVCDTPPDQSTAATPCNATVNSCNSDEDDLSINNPFRPISMGGLGDQNDFIKNYMDYAFPCGFMFTQGQADRMVFFLENVRTELLDAPSCNDPCLSSVTAAFTTPSTTINQGQTVNFTNTTTGGTTYEWSIYGTPFSTATNSSYLFNEQGIFTITLVATNAEPGCGDSFEMQIEVTCPNPPCIEICNNSIDDDNDGLADCLDPDCDCDDLCKDRGEADNWFFGSNAAMTFSGGGVPVSIPNSSLNASEGVASLSDSEGNLLLYTNGRSVWNANNNLMPNGTGLQGSNISAQSSIIVPLPESDSLYYIFTVPDWIANSAGLRYTVVDMSLDGGLGGVIATQKNISVDQNVAERVTAALHENCRDIWIVSHQRLNNNFVAYLLTPSGVSATPVTSSVGAITSGGNRYGALKLSHDGKQIASTLGGTQSGVTVALYDFDYATGVVSNEQIIADGGLISNAYSSEFSSDNSKLYVCSYNGSFVYQYDLSLATWPEVLASQTNVVGSASGIKGCIQIGPDNKIYVAKNGQSNMDVINFPNGVGLNCGYSTNVVNLNGNNARIGLPNFIPFYFESSLSLSGIDSICEGVPTTFLISRKDCESAIYSWELSGDLSIVDSTDQAITVIGSTTPQTTLIVVHKETLCGIESDSSTLVVYDCCNAGPEANLDLGPDIITCENDVFILGAGTDFLTYLWQDSSTNATLTTTDPGLYWVEVLDNCGFYQMDSITISIDPATILSLPDTTICDGESITINLNNFDDYQWFPDDGSIDCLDCETVTITPQSDTFYTVVGSTDLGCISVDSFTISTANAASINDTLHICYGDSILIFGNFESIPNDYSQAIPTPNGCDTIHTITLQVSQEILLDISLNNVNCSGDSTGSATVLAIGNNGNYSYDWDDPENQTTPTVDGLPAGNYMVTLTDDDTGCSVTTFIVIDEPEALTLTSISTAVSCNEANGSISLTVSGGTAPYFYVWNNLDTTNNPIGLLPDDYSVTVTDANDCTATSIIEVEESEILLATISMLSPISCNGEDDGSIDLTVVGGVMPYSFEWDNNAPDIQNPTGLEAGTYNVVVSDANDCTTTAQAILIEPSAIQLSTVSSSASCSNSSDGAIDLEVMGGAMPYAFDWSNASTNEDILGLSADNYTVTVTDNNGCTAITSEQVNSPDSILLSFNMVSDYNGFNVSCPTATDGAATVLASGGMAPISFNWSNGIGEATANELGAESYTVTATDSNGCTGESAITLSEPPEMQAFLEVQNINCINDEEGMIRVDTITGGTAPYVYALNGADFNSVGVFPNLVAGDYELSIQDANGCVIIFNETMNEPIGLDVNLNVIGGDNDLQLGDSIRIQAIVSSDTSRLEEWGWTEGLFWLDEGCDSCEIRWIYPMETTLYAYMAVNDNGCIGRDELLITVRKDRSVYIPNAFTPNGDGNNDFFQVYLGAGAQEVTNFRVYDRWGAVVYDMMQSNNVAESRQRWDGTFKGKRMNPGVFAYWIDVTFVDGHIERFTGDVTLMK